MDPKPPDSFDRHDHQQSVSGEHGHVEREPNGPLHAADAHPIGHRHEVTGVSDSRLLWAILLNQLLTVGQVLAGFLSGSFALLSDAAHNFSDANALLIAYIARRISRKAANEQFTFGYRRAETIGALINLTLLAVIGVGLVYEGISRFFQPAEIIGWLMAVAALLALVVDVATAMLLWAMSRGSLNVRAAFIHNLADAMGSLAVLLGAAAIIWLDWAWVDSVVTILIASYILWQVVVMLPPAIRMLMEGAPAHFDMPYLIHRLEQHPLVLNVHHVHVWELDEHHRALEAHIVFDRHDALDLESVKRDLKGILRDEFEVNHSTLEFEFFESRAEPESVVTDRSQKEH